MKRRLLCPGRPMVSSYTLRSAHPNVERIDLSPKLGGTGKGQERVGIAFASLGWVYLPSWAEGRVPR